MDDKRPLATALVSGLGLGYLPLAPGTWGSAGATVSAFLIYSWLPHSRSTVFLLFLVLICLWAGVRLGPWVERHFGRKDPGVFVLDELAGQWLTCALCFLLCPVSIAWVIGAFVSFRIFDIAKVPPVCNLEKLPGGWGIMLDDLAAALYATAGLWVLVYLEPDLFGLA